MTTDSHPTRAPHVNQATVAAFRAGDPAAAGAVYDRYARAVWTVTRRVLTDSGLAEDSVQETFVKAWRARDSMPADRDPGAWLLTIARRTAIDTWRRESRPTQGGHAPEQDSPVVLPGLERAWEAWAIRCALDELPADEREVVRLAHFAHMTQAEVATALGVPVGTVKSRSHRAHRRLAQLLGHLRDHGSSTDVAHAAPSGGGDR